VAAFVVAQLPLWCGSSGRKDCARRRRCGSEREAEVIQELNASRKQKQADEAVHAEFLESMTIPDPKGRAKDRMAALKDAGVAHLQCTRYRSTLKRTRPSSK
jgi:hypothetical protein